MTENKKPDIRKAEILEAALKRFNAGGYHKTKVDDIAADVGITKAGVYYRRSNSRHWIILRQSKFPHMTTLIPIIPLKPICNSHNQSFP